MAEYVRGKVFGSMLARVLNLPPNTISFDLHCKLNEVVSVRCECHPPIDSLQGAIPIIKEYYLVDKDDANREHRLVEELSKQLEALKAAPSEALKTASSTAEDPNS